MPTEHNICNGNRNAHSLLPTVLPQQDMTNTQLPQLMRLLSLNPKMLQFCHECSENPLVTVYGAAEMVWGACKANPADPPVCKSMLIYAALCMLRPLSCSSLQGRQWWEQDETGTGSSSTVPCRNPKKRIFGSFVSTPSTSRLCSHSCRSLHLLLFLLPSPLPQERGHCSQDHSAGIQQFAPLSLLYCTFPKATLALRSC